MRILYQNTFDTTAHLTHPLVVVSGGGNVLHSGSSLRIVCPAAQDCTWWSSDYDAPTAYVHEDTGFLQGSESDVAVSGYVSSGVVGSGQVTGGGAGIVWGECRLLAVSSGVYTDDQPKSGLTLYEKEDDVWQLSYNHVLENVTLQKIINGSATTVETTAVSGVNDPNSAPLRLRLYLNKHDSRTVLNDRNNAMSPGQVAAYYSDTDGVLWTKVGSNQSAGIKVDAAGFGVFMKRSVDSPTTEAWAHFDSLRIAVNEAHELLFASGGADGEAVTAAFEDALTHWYNPHAITGDTTVSGMLDKKPGRLTDADNNYQSKAAFEDDLYHAFDRLVYPSERPEGVNDADFGGVSAWEDDLSYDQNLQRNLGRLDENDNHHQSKSAWEDALAFTWDPTADWQSGTTDADGRDFIQGYSIESMLYHDTTVDPWHNPTQSGFHGVGRDGYHYHDGHATSLYEPLATAASGIPPASWASHNQPLPGMWPSHVSSYYNVTYPTASGELRLDSTTALDGWQRAGVSTFGRWTLSGDFDIEVGFKGTSESGGTSGGIYLEIMKDWNHRVYVYRSHDNYHRSGLQNEGSYTGGAVEYYNANTGKLRLTRSGSTVKAYYWSGAWNRIGGDYNFGTWNAHIVTSVAGTGSWNIDTTLYNFRVNSGTVSRTCGWRRESAGTHRGSRSDFPERVWFIAGQSSLNIIDADNNKLWMRFPAGNLDAYHNSSGTGIKSMAFHDGVLWVGCASNNGGHVHRMDFNTEDCRYVANSSSKAFGRYKFQSGNAYWGYSSAIGGIRDRDGNNDFNGDFPNWELPGNKCYGVSVAHDSNIAMETVAIATSGGVVVHYYNRWKFGEWDGIEYHNQWANNAGKQAFWCYLDPSNQDLYWLNKDHFCYASKATYHAGWPTNTYGADSYIDIPNRKLGRWEQYQMVRYGGYFYLASELGVYRITDPSSNWQLVIGRPNSGAVNETLTPSCEAVIRVALTQDSGIDLLMVLVENEAHGWTQVLFYRLDTFEVYAKSQLITGKTGQPKALLAR